MTDPVRRALLLALGACAAAPPVAAAGRPAPNISAPNFTIGADPRIELYAVVLGLSGYRGFPPQARVYTDFVFAYRTEAETRFAPDRDQPVVALYREMAEHGFRFAHPPSAMLHLSDPPALARTGPIDPLTLRMAGGQARLDAFVAGMRDFALNSRFRPWYDAHLAFYRDIAATYRSRMEWNYVQDLADYYGKARKAYRLILAPLFHPGGFGPRVRQPDGRYAAFAIVGTRGVVDGKPDFGTAEDMRRLLWHEFSHSHVNHLTERHLDLFMAPVSRLQAGVRKEVEAVMPWSIHVADWVSEHVVRGVTSRLAYLKVGRAEGDRALALEVEQFPYVAEVCERLTAYEADRARWPTFAAFFPNLAAVFQAAAAKAPA